MRKAIVIGTAALVCAVQAPSAQATTVKDPSVQCRYRRGGHWSDQDVKAAIRCAVDRWPVSGGVRKALSVARCESGFNEHDRNPTSSAAGVYQFLSGTWRAVKQHYRRVKWRYRLSGRVENARSNVLLAIRYAHAGGWGPWSCA